MTKSTGKRAAQKRREDLLWGELVLWRMLRHLEDRRSLCGECGAPGLAFGYDCAWTIVWLALLAALEEREELPC